MAPYASDAARSTQTKVHRPTPIVPRIVPAIPLALSRAQRASRPVTLEDAEHKHAVKENVKVELHGAAKRPEEQQDVAGAQDPPTPDSKMSTADNQGSDDTDLQETPATSFGADAVQTATESAKELSPVHKSVPVEEEQRTESATGFPSCPPNTLQQPRHELPPPFYPSENLSTPTSTTSSSAPQTFASHQNPVMHHPRPSTNSIVFGGYADSSNTSPAPPTSAGMMPYPAPPPPPGFIGADFGPPPFIPPGHAHNLSDPHIYPMYGPMGMAPPAGYGYSREHAPPPLDGRSQPWFPPDAYMHYRMGPQRPFSPRRGPNYVNGAGHTSRSHSQTSLKAQDGEVRQNQLANGVTPPAPRVQVRDDSANELRDYLITQFGNRDLADYILEVSVSGTTIIAIPIHGVIVARSPTIASAIAAQAFDSMSDGTNARILRLSVVDKFLDNVALSEAIRYLYGAAPLTLRDLNQGLQPFSNDVKVGETSTEPAHRMGQALAYAAAGHFLQISGIVNHGLNAARGLLRWDTVEGALSFALDESYGTSSARFLQDAVDFMSYNFPKDFSLIRTASPLAEDPLLPVAIESTTRRHSSALSRIQFGAVPLEGPAHPTFVTTVLSSILLSLPFDILVSLFQKHALGNRLGWGKTVELMHSVVEERETRRKDAIRSQGKSAKGNDGDARQLENLRWEERVEPSDQHPCGYQLAQYKTIGSSGSANGGSHA